MSLARSIEGLVIDTDVVSFLLKGDSRRESYRAEIEQADRTLILSFMTVAELDRWALERRWGENRRRSMERFLQERFLVHDQINRELCRTWARIMKDVHSLGRHVSCADAWIAATAIALRVPLLTHNRRDFASIPGLTLRPTVEPA